MSNSVLPLTGEDSFFARLFQNLPTMPESVVVPPGDDCAGVRIGEGRLLLVAVDQLVGDRHYWATGEDATPPRLAGRKLLARNLSDIAAMGGFPTFCLLAGAFPKSRPQSWLEEYYGGIIDTAHEYSVAMIGGDFAATAKGDEVASLTILGEVEEQQVLLRSGAHPGDCLYATGCFGSSFPSGHHLKFMPRCQEGRWLATHRLACAAMDVSDGLLVDLARICRASGVGCQLDLNRIPRRTAQTTIQQALTDGEDYELLFAVPSAAEQELLRLWPFQTALTRLGAFDASGMMSDQDGRPLSIAGWDHFQH